MSETIKKGDFVELDFTASCEGEVFDTTNAEIAKKLGYKKDREIKPVKIIVGERMLIEGLDNALIGKEIEKEYIVKINPSEAFGERKQELIKAVPVNAFKDKNLREGSMFVIDGLLAKVIRVASGRILLDFNHPLAGKEVTYKFKVLRKIENLQEKISALVEYFNVEVKIINVDGKTIIKTKKDNFFIEKTIKAYIPENIEFEYV